MKHLITEIEVTKVKKELQAHVKERIDKNQKDYILREQMKVIREELGEDNPLSDSDEYAKRLKALKADKEIKEKIQKRSTALNPCQVEARKLMLYGCIWIQFLIFHGRRCRRITNSIIHAQQVLDEEIMAWKK